MPLSETKICGRCGLEKSIDEFGFRYVKLGIRHSWCKSCFVEYKRLWYERNGDRHRAHVKERRAAAEDENQRRVWELGDASLRRLRRERSRCSSFRPPAR